MNRLRFFLSLGMFALGLTLTAGDLLALSPWCEPDTEIVVEDETCVTDGTQIRIEDTYFCVFECENAGTVLQPYHPE